MPMIKSQVVTDEMMIDEVRIRMRCKGYRPVTEMDVVPDRELVMVDIERYYLSGADLPPIGMAGTTIVKLDSEKTIHGINANKQPIVWYHCTSPAWDGQCFIPLPGLVRDAYVLHGNLDNDTRYFVKG